MRQYLWALLTGALFGVGLNLSQMTDRERVLAFMDVTGKWDPSLIFVLAGAVAVTLIAFRFVLRQPRPLLAEKFHLPTKRDLDQPLVVGAAIFGIGWGISGYCPGPGIASLASGAWNPILFLAAVIAGSQLYHWSNVRSQRQQAFALANTNQAGRDRFSTAQVTSELGAVDNSANRGCA